MSLPETLTLTDDELRCLGWLRMVGTAQQASDLVRNGRPGYPHLTRLEARGLTTSNRGWWRITDDGVKHLLDQPIGRLKEANVYG